MLRLLGRFSTAQSEACSAAGTRTPHTAVLGIPAADKAAGASPNCSSTTRRSLRTPSPRSTRAAPDSATQRNTQKTDKERRTPQLAAEFSMSSQRPSAGALGSFLSQWVQASIYPESGPPAAQTTPSQSPLAQRAPQSVPSVSSPREKTATQPASQQSKCHMSQQIVRLQAANRANWTAAANKKRRFPHSDRTRQTAAKG